MDENQQPKKHSVRFVTITESHAGQRIDNFLMRELKDVPRSYIYRILRKGEVRVNKKRIKPTFKLGENDIVRIPPVFLPDKKDQSLSPDVVLKTLDKAILSEDDDLIFINKPSGMAVHGGSGIRFGLIESFRQLRPDLSYIELVHRLDKDTSGIVMLAKNRQALLNLHAMMKHNAINKRYLTLVSGQWTGGRQHIKNFLQKSRGRQQKVQVLDSGAKDEKGKESESIFEPVETYKDSTLMDVALLTGRMHQIRTQLQNLGHPVLGDSQYGDFARNRYYKKSVGLKRLFLHAYHLDFVLTHNGKHYDVKIPLADDLQAVIGQLRGEQLNKNTNIV